MSTVYLAHQTKLNRPVALKLLSPPPSGDEATAFEHRFRREAQTLAQLDHNNIVVLHDYGETEDGRFYLAMEYIDGPRLSDLLKDGPLPAQQALNLLIQVCAGLRYAHKRGVVHRDLKPSNLLVRRNEEEVDQVKIVDFGLVKLVESDQSITRAGLILGSPHCMAPEQVKGLGIDHRADIYAMGVLLFRTLTGQYPFHGTNSAATMIAHLNQPIPTFFSVAPEIEVPPGLEEIVRRCLAKNPADRYGDMRELIEALGPMMDVPPEGLGIRTLTHSHSMLPGLSSEVRARRPAANAATTRALIAAAFFGSAALFAAILVALGLVAVGGLLQARWAVPPQAPTVVVAPALPAPALPAPALPAPALPAPALDAPLPVPPTVAAPAPVEPSPAPVPAPVPVARPVTKDRAPTPRPAPAPAPAPVAAAPPANPDPPPGTPDPTEAPEGYLGLPDDLME